jgi:hypothetical protein
MASVTRAIHLVVGLVAVSLVADAARTKASLEPAIVAGLSSTLQVKVANVCTEDVVKTGCEAIAFSHDGRASSAGIAAVLDVKMADADAFLVALGFPGDTSGGFDCRAFCEASVAAISDVLGEEIPPAAGVACLVPSCEHTVDVSDEALQKEGLGTPEEHQQEAEQRDQIEEVETNVTIGDTAVAPTPHTTTKDLLRRALNVFFQAFPAPEHATEDWADESLLEHDPSFGPVITRHRESRERRRKFTAYIQKASAWVSSALRKLETPYPSSSTSRCVSAATSGGGRRGILWTRQQVGLDGQHAEAAVLKERRSPRAARADARSYGGCGGGGGARGRTRGNEADDGRADHTCGRSGRVAQ